jgi:rod shape determining protein RodA
MLASKLSHEFTVFQKIRNIDYILLISIFILGLVSIVTMYSTDGGEILYHTKSHFVRFLIFFPMMIILSFINLKFWHTTSYLFYAIVLGLLIWVSLYGVQASGSRRWINLYFLNLQPSELMKIGVILCLAKFFHRIRLEKTNNFASILISVTIIIVPTTLVVSQPDLGTSILIAITGFMVLWLTGLKVKYFMYSGILFLISLPFVISFLKPYQKLRILTFINPDRDPLGAGYQIIQSKIAVGSGGLTGKGFLKGTQSYLDFLPEKHTDFIFTLFSEEFGFYGSILLLILYAIIIFRVVRIGLISRSFFARIFCFSFAFAIFLYVSINMSMVLGLLPIVGSPLPIMSYGGSSMLTTMIGFSIVMSAKINYNQNIS